MITKMRRVSRLQGDLKPKRPVQRTLTDWHALYRQTLFAAERAESPLVTRLKGGGGDPERLLRQMGIVSAMDIEREFPNP